MATVHKDKQFKAVLAAAKNLKVACVTNQDYTKILLLTLKPFTKNGRAISFTNLRARDYELCLEALAKATEQVLDSRSESDLLIDFLALKIRAEKLGYVMTLERIEK